MNVEMLPRRARGLPATRRGPTIGLATEPMENGMASTNEEEIVALWLRVAGMEKATEIVLESMIAVLVTDDLDRAQVMCELVRDRLTDWSREKDPRTTHAADEFRQVADRLHREVLRRQSAGA